MRRSPLHPRIVPSMLAADMAESLAFYTAILGFEITGREPTGAADARLAWAELVRGGVTIHLFAEPTIGMPPAPAFSGTLYFFPESLDALVEELRDRVEFAWGPEEMPYGWREFGVRDPNGYWLAFAQPID